MIENYFGEDKNIEFKQMIPSNHDKFLKDIIAFSNCTGGKVIVGIVDKTHEVCGIGDVNPFELSDSITTMISDACQPQIEAEISIQTLEGKTILVVDVPAGKFRPYYLKAKGKETTTYVRMNGTSRPADPRRLKELEMEGLSIHFDTLQEIGMEYDEKQVLDLCNKMHEVALQNSKSKEERAQVKEMTIAKLENIGFLKKVADQTVPTHAYNLFTNNDMMHAKIQCALFKGTTRSVFIDRKEFTGPIYQQVEDAYAFVLRHINMGAVIDGLYRHDVYELPVSAIREAITNGVAHRSYVDDSFMQVSIYDDRIDFLSPGGMYGGLDIASALEGKSRYRNTAIAQAFHYMKIMDTWGTGLMRIVNACKEHGLKKPKIEELGDSFLLTIYRHSNDEFSEAIDDANHPVKTEQNEPINENENNDLSDTERKIIALMKENPRITKAEIARLLGMSASGVKYNLQKLRDKEIVDRIGGSKLGNWVIKEK